MTTDVINGVPRSLLRLLADSAEHGYGIDNENLEVARALLATAQHAADGERELIREVFLRNGFSIKDGHDDLKPYVYAAGFDLLEQARAAQPQQAVAVTDEVSKLREALEELLGCPHNVVQATVPKAGIEAAPPYQVVLDVSVSLTRWRKAQAALSAHKSGEEE